MDKKEHRRKSKRYPVSWEATLVFDKSNGTLIVNAQTQDISRGGASILSEHADLDGSVITMVLTPPPRGGSKDAPTFRVRARIVSSTRRPLPPQFRHGVNFMPSSGESLEFLDALLDNAAAVPAGEDAGAPAVSTPVSTAVTSRLEQLRQLAQAKAAEQKPPESKEDMEAQVSLALRRAYDYLKELADQLNIVKPAYARGYAIVGVPEFADLAWESGRADLRNRVVSPTKTICEQVTLNFRISGNKNIRVSRESPASDRLKQILTDNKIEFKARDERRGSTAFEFACDVRASVILDGQFDAGRILLKTRNVERFGMLEHQLAPGAVTRESLEEFAGFILGETNRVGPLLLKKP